MTHEQGSHREACSLWTRGDWYCGKVHAWNFVGPVVKDVDGSPREAIWAHAPEHGARLVVTYPAVPLGQQLELEVGLTLRGVLSREGSDVHFLVRIAGDPVAVKTLAPTQQGWFPLRVDTSRWAGQRQPVAFVVWAKDNQVRQLLFDGRSWEH